MDYFRLNESDFSELLFDMKSLKKAYENRENRFDKHINLGKELGYYKINSVRKGNVYCTTSKINFSQNTIVESDQAFQSLTLYFILKGGCYTYNKNTKQKIYVPSNNHNVFIMQEDNSEVSMVEKNMVQSAFSLHLPLSYFETLINLYPHLFEASFNRYNQGESFYLKDAYEKISPEINHVLFQIENANLMGNCIEPYMDAKILELLSLQFQKNKPSNNSQLTSNDTDKIKEAAYILISDIHNPPSIRDLALNIGINEKKLKQGFKAVFNTTVYGYLFNYKMSLARQLLLDTNKSIYEIGLQCGYDYPSHFSTAFKRNFNISPNEFKKKYRT